MYQETNRRTLTSELALTVRTGNRRFIDCNDSHLLETIRQQGLQGVIGSR